MRGYGTYLRSTGAGFWAVFTICGLTVADCRAQGRIDVEAVSGEPYGVGRMTVELPPEALPEPLGAEGLGLSEKNGRVLFPASNAAKVNFSAVAKEFLEASSLLQGGPARREARGILQGLLSRPPRTTIYFLFRGDEPLDLTLQAKTALASRVFPRPARLTHQQMLQAWWDEYTAAPSLLQPKPDYPPLVETYLKAMLARQLNLRLPKRTQTDSPRELLTREVGLMMGSEAVRTAMEQDRVLGLGDLALAADQPLPAPVDAPPPEIPEPAADVAVEPIAMRVPPECLYVRFGNFGNFLWFQDTLARWGGDLQNLLAARGLDHGLSHKVEDQLGLKQTELSRILGGTVVADVALIGTDTFFREGASFGILFQARSNVALSTALGQQRQERIKSGGATEQKVKIAAREVSYLSTPNGSIRSYFVTDGDYHLVTTSRAIARRFLETAAKGTGLGSTKEFRHARTILPLGREDTVWIYLSDPFFRNITGPHYRIETARRLQASVDIEVVELAVLAAATQQKPGGAIDRLVSGGLLPPDFGARPDGGQAVLQKGEVHDSVRGWQGAFVPVPDVPLSAATRAEMTDYAKFAAGLQENWGRIAPVIAGLKRTDAGEGREQVTIEARMSPLAVKQFEQLSRIVGPASAQQLAPISGDIAHGELVLRSQLLFAGLQDFIPRPAPPEGQQQAFSIGRLRDWLVGYIGTTGELGLLSFLDRPLLAPRPEESATPRTEKGAIVPREEGGERLLQALRRREGGILRGVEGGPGPLQAMRRKSGPFTVFSLQPEVLAEVVPQLRFVETRRPAQVRLWITDPSRTKAASMLNNLGYMRTRETSLGNLRLLHQLDQQLHVPPQNCKEAAEFLLAAKLVCPLGGQYVYHQSADEPGHWTSTVLLEDRRPRGLLSAQAPEGYLAPPLSWFRGLTLDATMTEKLLTAHAETIMQGPAKK